MNRWILCVAAFVTVVGVARPETYPLYGQMATSTVLKNDCVDQSRWNITVKPDPNMKLKGTPYTQYHRGTPDCEPQDTQADADGNPIYIFEFNIFEMNCGITEAAFPNNGTFKVTIVLPFRTDGVEVREDHIMFFECAIPTAQWHFNESVGGIEPAWTDFNPNKTDETGVRPPTVRVAVYRNTTEMRPGDQAFLGETLTMRVEVLDDGDVYTKVKVQELWATYANEPTAATKLDLMTSGCSLESAMIEAGIPIFENFVVSGSESRIEAHFRVFRFAGQQNVYFWLTITSCSYADDVTCVLCVDTRKKRSLGMQMPFAVEEDGHTRVRRSFRSAFTHQVAIGEIQLLKSMRMRREAGVLIPEDEVDDEGSLSGMTNFNLVVYNPDELTQTDGSLETDNAPPPKADVAVVPEPAASNDVCLSVAQTAIFGVVGLILIGCSIGVALFLFFKLRSIRRRALKVGFNGVNGSMVLGDKLGSKPMDFNHNVQIPAQLPTVPNL